jgi:hypothetical protein
MFEENKWRNSECHSRVGTDSHVATFKRLDFIISTSDLLMPLLQNASSRAVDHGNDMKATALLHGAANVKLLPLTGSSSNPRTANLWVVAAYKLDGQLL